MENSKNFPSLVCHSCHDLIKISYNFSQVCCQSDQSLQDCYQKTLNETKAKLNFKDSEKISAEVKIEPSDSIKSEDQIYISDKSFVHTECEANSIEVKQKVIQKEKCLHSLAKSDVIKQRHQKNNSLSERLKEAQSKLAEDISRSNYLMLNLERSNELNKDNTNLSYYCPQCSLNYVSLEALKLHFLATHEQTRKFKSLVKFQCKECTRNFSEKNQLLSHYVNVHNIPETSLSCEDLKFIVKKSAQSRKRKFYCIHCTPYRIFENRSDLLKHLKESHNVNEKEYNNKMYESTVLLSNKDYENHTTDSDELNENEVKNKINGEIPKNENCSYQQKLPKTFVCDECSPASTFYSLAECMQHKLKLHDTKAENISVKESSLENSESLDVLKQNAEGRERINFKVLCRNCDPPVEFLSASLFVNHMHSLHEGFISQNWEIESNQTQESKEGGTNKGQETWKCTECPLIYFRKQSLHHHMKEKHNKVMNVRMMKCPDCDESFTNRQLIQHGLSVHQKYFAHIHKVYKKNILQSHEEDSRIKNFECDICQKKYICKNSFKRHVLKAHLGMKEVESILCPYCGKTLSNKLNLKSHIEFVHEALFVSCPICKKKINFRTIGKHYKTHKNSTDFIDSKTHFLCNLCGKILRSKRGFEDHQKLHKNIRDQLCDVCGSGFTSKKFLHLHKKSHDGIQRKVFNCSQCEKVFSGRHTLNRHLLTHSGEKNFICEICSKCFYTLQELNRHVRYHKKEYRFDCQLCDMRFLDKSRFRHHMMRHRNIRPHKCQFCDKMFIVRRKMNLHMAAKHHVEIKNTKSVWKDPKTYIPLDDLL